MSVAKVADVFVGDKNSSYSASLLTFCKKVCYNRKTVWEFF